MKVTGIKYISPLYDNSGYAKASRGYVLALHNAGVPIMVTPISFEKTHPDLGEDGEILKSLEQPIDYNVVIIHTTPEFWQRCVEPNKINIGYTIWETTKLHPLWAGHINDNVDKVLVGCEWNVETFRNSGVTIPIGVIPHTIPKGDYESATEYNINGIKDDAYVFYSIFQWTERKDPNSLLKAYWYAFQNDENVALVLKTYRGDYSDNEKTAVRESIKRLKEITVFDKYPPVYLIPDMLTEDEMRGLHVRGDCYVSLDRGEGFGLSPFTAGAYGNPIIVTDFGGATEYAKEDTAYLVDYTLAPVHGMPWSPWYRGDQLWAQADVVGGAMQMQHVYNHQDYAKKRGSMLKEYINDSFNDRVIANKIVKEIESL